MTGDEIDAIVEQESVKERGRTMDNNKVTPPVLSTTDAKGSGLTKEEDEGPNVDRRPLTAQLLRAEHKSTPQEVSSPAGKRKRVPVSEGAEAADDKELEANVKRPRSPDETENVADEIIADTPSGSREGSLEAEKGQPMELKSGSNSPNKQEPSVKVTNPFLKNPGSTNTTWDDLVPEVEAEKVKIKTPTKTPDSAFAGIMKPAGHSMLASPMNTPGITPSSLGVLGASAGASTGGGWSSWADAGKKSGEGNTTPPSAAASMSISATNSAANTPVKSKLEKYVFGSAFGGSGFGAVAPKSSNSLFGSSSAAASPSFASLASTTRTVTEEKKAEKEPSQDFSTLLNTPQKKRAAELPIGSPMVVNNKQQGPEEAKALSGEEDETTKFQSRAKLFVWDASQEGKERWRERAKGVIKVNVKTTEPTQGRLLMRSEGALRLVLNTKIYPSMKTNIISEKYAEFLGTSLEEPGKVVKYLLQFGKREPAAELKEALDKIAATGATESAESK
ncbi:hypothetical protein DFS34DRAFT_488013 [Phlyctochytrium arcticum]|nr:hypothetical protein DFS34DRAFT_488013 [Phlyctochytrium arcticum]